MGTAFINYCKMWKLLIPLALFGVAVAKVDYTGYRVLRAYPTPEQLNTIETLKEKYDLDIWLDYGKASGYMDFMVRPVVRSLVEETLDHFRIPYEIFIEDVEEASRAQLQSNTKATDFYGNYHTLEEINNWMDEFASTHQSTVSKVTIGTTFEGRGINGLKIGTGPDVFFIHCGIHAREWITTATCLYTANRLLETDSDQLTSLTYYIVPSANPDGYAYTWSDDRMWRKTRNPAGTACVGVDPNRNFAYAWSQEGASSNPCTQTYYGPEAFSESETQALRDYIGQLGSTVKAYIDIHAYSQMWMYPYGYSNVECADSGDLGAITTNVLAAIRGVHRKRYTGGPIATTIYPASGTTVDYFYETGKIKCSFTAELRDTGAYGFLLPEDQIIPTGEETYAGLQVMAEAILDGTCA